MKISLKEKNSHRRWLGTNLTKYTPDSSLAEDQMLPELSIKLVPILRGPRRPVEPVCKFRYKDMNTIRIPIFWEFREIWRCATRPLKKEIEYEFCDLNIKIYYEEEAEFLSVHWRCGSADIEKYQPHWHLKSNIKSFYINKIHFPLNHFWEKYYPDTVDEYHKWLRGFLDFLFDEFPRCLYK